MYHIVTSLTTYLSVWLSYMHSKKYISVPVPSFNSVVSSPLLVSALLPRCCNVAYRGGTHVTTAFITADYDVKELPGWPCWRTHKSVATANLWCVFLHGCTMPSFCAIVGCGNRGQRDVKSFFRLPAVITNQGEKTESLSRRRRCLWLSRIARDNLRDSTLPYIRVCSDHFVSG